MKQSEFLKYVFFSSACFVLNVVVYMLAFQFLGQNIIFANVLAFIVQTVASYVTDKKYVFPRGQKQPRGQFILFFIIKFIALVVDTVLLFWMYHGLGMSNFWAKIVSSCSTTVGTYAANKGLVFKN